MSAFSRDELHTDRSMQQESDSNMSHQACDSFYFNKMEYHLAFMEREFKRNIDWQRTILHEIRKDRKGHQEPQRKNGSTITLHLKQKEEEKLKEVLKDYCCITHDRLQLSQLIKLAVSLKDKWPLQQEKENDISFPILPRVITLNDLAPSTQRYLDSSKVSPIRIVESRVKVPKYRKATKSPHQLFSPEPEEPSPGKSKYGLEQHMNNQRPQFMKQEKVMEDSIEKRLQELDSNNFVTFREYLLDSFRNKPSENVSLNFSSSHQEEQAVSPGTDKDSLLLISDDQELQRNPSIYLQLKLSRQQQQKAEKDEKVKKQQEILCFSATKKRKIGRAKDRVPKNVLPRQDECKMRLKKLQDSFGKIYHEYQQAKHIQEPIWKPLHHNDRETLESDD